MMILLVVLAGLLYALPNLFSQDPSIEIAPVGDAVPDAGTSARIKAALENAGLTAKAIEPRGEFKLLVRFASSETQLQARDLIAAALGDSFTAALTLAPDVPGWLEWLGAQPMYLGLDLRGGIHVLIDVDMDAAVEKSLERYTGDIRTLLRGEKVRYVTVGHDRETLVVKFRDAAIRDQAEALISREFNGLVLEPRDEPGYFNLAATLSAADTRAVRKFALEQNITTLRNRVNALGVAEPVIQQQGERRIVVELPGVQDPSRLKEILGATATLEYRLVDTEHSAADAASGRVPVGTRLYQTREGGPILLKTRVIVTGDQITDASSGFDQRSGQPAVFVNLDGQGARRMREVTNENVGKPMAVVFIESRTQTRMVNGQPVKQKQLVEEVISVANILEPFGRRFQTTGLDSPREAHNLALLLRAGALAAPIEIVEERTVGPSLGQDNIDQGVESVAIGMAAVMIFMVFYYRVFGLVANLVLVLNLVLIVALLSMLQATLTLPGIAGIVLTVGMAVDANVLIYERIREELRNGSTPQASIHAGFDKALSTIVDANITTLIAAVVLFSFGTGPIKGFAVTLFIGILTSMFTAILGSRAIVNLIYGRRRVASLLI
jgi:preprotein translocase subunit SecD